MIEARVHALPFWSLNRKSGTTSPTWGPNFETSIFVRGGGVVCGDAATLDHPNNPERPTKNKRRRPGIDVFSSGRLEDPPTDNAPGPQIIPQSGINWCRRAFDSQAGGSTGPLKGARYERIRMGRRRGVGRGNVHLRGGTGSAAQGH